MAPIVRARGPAGSHEPHGPCYVWNNNSFDMRRVWARLVRHSCRFRGSDSRTRDADKETNLAPIVRVREYASSHEPYGTYCSIESRFRDGRRVWAQLVSIGGVPRDCPRAHDDDTACCVIDAVRGDRSVWRLGRCLTFLRVGHGMSTTWV